MTDWEQLQPDVGPANMNLNEECLLQFLKNDPPAHLARQKTGQDAADQDGGLGGFLTRNLSRILRNRHYVSFPAAILLRRPNQPQD